MKLEDFKQKEHFPVLIREVLQNLNPEDGKVYIDCTFGLGSYSLAILQKAKSHVIAFDRDINTKKYADELKKEYKNRFTYINTEFSKAKSVLKELGIQKVDGACLDLGFSSMQINSDRGFSFQKDGELDMRMNTNSNTDAKVVVNSFSAKQIADILFKFGEERKSFKIADAIVNFRTNVKKIETSKELAKIVHGVYGTEKIKGINTATKTFQAIRIFVNNELEELENFLQLASDIIKQGGRLLVVSFHSLEDRIVKEFVRGRAKIAHEIEKYSLQSLVTKDKLFKEVVKGVIIPEEEEIRMNAASRSAKLRVLERI